jgi:DNA-binding NarL/FixJ family response regulator
MKEKIRVLLVDDNPSFRKGMRALLEIQPDMRVVGEAPDGLTALECIGPLRPDLILLDARMPRMTGADVTRIVKDRWPRTKVVILTMFNDRQRALVAGADAFLTKGIPPEQILSRIRGIVQEEGTLRINRAMGKEE